ncbi:hypothetical protein EDC01DRAFT_645596 [Geopyxis carbonaria]|nr:hypothetical protein EDC01DRAFT_645596 [Geopyxis carbonaria]
MGSKTYKLLSIPLRALALLVCLYILAVSAYHIQHIAATALRASGHTYAITIISGLGAVWALLSLLTACFFPRSLFLPILVFDILYSAAHVAVAVLLRPPFCSRTSTLWTKSASVYRGRGRIDCGIDKGAFGAAIAAAVLFALLAVASFGAWRSHRANRAFGPGPQNGYDVNGVHNEKKHRKHRRGSDEEAVIPAAAPASETYTRPAGYREPAVPMAATGGQYGVDGYGNATTGPQTGSVHLGGAGAGRTGANGAFNPELKGHGQQQPGGYAY